MVGCILRTVGIPNVEMCLYSCRTSSLGGCVYLQRTFLINNHPRKMAPNGHDRCQHFCPATGRLQNGTKLPHVHRRDQGRVSGEGDGRELPRGGLRRVDEVPEDVVRPVRAHGAHPAAPVHGLVVPEAAARRLHLSVACCCVTQREIRIKQNLLKLYVHKIG
jgi:hypothetical protein